MKRFAIVLLPAVAGLLLFGHGAYIQAKAWLAQVLLERAFARDHRHRSPCKTVVVGRHVSGRAHRGETASRSAIVLAGSSGQALAFGPGHLELTPDAGERGVAVYAAHRDTHFRFLRDVGIGDEIDITRSDGKTFRYRADRASVVRFDASGIDPLGKRI